MSILIFFFVLGAFQGSLSLNCYNCTDLSTECFTGQCTDNFCSHQIVIDKREKTQRITKTCTDINPLGSDNCKTVNLGGDQGINCFCKGTDQCNNGKFFEKMPIFANFLGKANIVQTTGNGSLVQLQTTTIENKQEKNENVTQIPITTAAASEIPQEKKNISTATEPQKTGGAGESLKVSFVLATCFLIVNFLF